MIENNELEIYDMENDVAEMHNLALDLKKNRDLIWRLQLLMNEIIVRKVGKDDGSFIQIKSGKLYFKELDEKSSV